MLGLSDSWQGVIQDTASTSTLVALLSARERTSDYGLVRGGLQAEDRPLVVYVSAHSHSSVDKAALLAGFGRQNVRVVSHDANFGMCPESLDAAIRRDISEGRKPCAVVLTTGTTTTTAVDPLRSSIEAAKRHGLWVHVDCGDGWFGHDSAGMPLDVGWDRRSRFDGRESAQVDGSARIGRHCTLGGGAIVLGHLELADHVHITAATVVTRSIREPGRYSGLFPFDDNASGEKNAATLRQLHSLRERIRALEKKP